jgi:hypothetical protein
MTFLKPTTSNNSVRPFAPPALTFECSLRCYWLLVFSWLFKEVDIKGNTQDLELAEGGMLLRNFTCVKGIE